ncbi:hypothetical protein O181_131750 [Austropuccinia psidii MF-1]|uniref:Uncharacterized protein n=1 Tax=Austropuccinia psidii MF-1 TaxID=1389203 RepID=A0A9Q3L1J1_9BASI|nr:hypothetical protein [Austropuccinia psidii MF-1]
MTHTLTYNRIQSVQLCHHHAGKGIGPYTRAYAPAPAHAQANATTLKDAYANATALADAHANATAVHPRYCVVGSTSVIRKMAIPRKWSPFMDDLVRSNPPLYIKTG